jgi:hypothetical protein
VAGCCECGDEPSGSCVTELVSRSSSFSCSSSSSNSSNNNTSSTIAVIFAAVASI